MLQCSNVTFIPSATAAFTRVAYTEWGSGPHVVVCVHGLARNSRDFDFLAAALTPECRVLCMDVVGRGESDWLDNKSEYTFATYQSDASAMLARASAPAPSPFFKRERPVVLDWVGTSMGGLIGMFLAARRNSPIRRLVLNDVGALIPWSALFRMKGYITRGRRFSDLGEVEAYLRKVCAQFGELSDPQWQHLARHSAQRENGTGSSPYVLRYDPAIGEGLHGHIDREFPIGPDLLRGIDLWNVWRKITCPVLVLRGADSDVLLKKTLDEMRARKPDLEVAEFAGVGHAPALMDAEQIAAVKRFLLA